VHTDYPVMPSTGIKGVFRACYKSATEELFGKGDEEGSLIFTDGKILFFPVKSARGVFVWITCPFVLDRFKRDMSIVNKDINIEDIKFDNDEQAYVFSDNVLVNNHLILEELSFQKKDKVKLNWLDTFNIGIDKSKLAIISDDMFKYLVKNSTEINARIRIDQETGTAQEGALWYEELVPAETVFYSLVLERKSGSVEKLKKFICDDQKSFFQFGGDETLGRGFAKVIAFDGR
ncbi:MAG: type III-B CRISPR module RAMP protein Cmr4, partial [Candidatus Micrarchaeota archaeon]|nr:type III-B CRISPR module RAMP protein Cmr4 [Candidatus Micrarchaeota archaeon]